MQLFKLRATFPHAMIFNMSRHSLTKTQRYKIFLMFDGTCAYCQCSLDLENFDCDHFIPRSITKSSKLNEFVPSCPDCNNIKSDRTFYSDSELLVFIHRERHARGLSYLSQYVHQETEVAEVLLSDLQNATLVDPQQTSRDEKSSEAIGDVS